LRKQKQEGKYISINYFNILFGKTFSKCLYPDNVLSPVADCQAKHRGKCSTYAVGVEWRNHNRAKGTCF
jgi:hypothetical protein